MNPAQIAAEAAERFSVEADLPLTPRECKLLESIIQTAIEKATEQLHTELNEQAGVILQGMVEVQRLRNLLNPSGKTATGSEPFPKNQDEINAIGKAQDDALRADSDSGK